MDTQNWITIGIAAITLINSWLQLWAKERLFTSSNTTNDVVLMAFKSRIGLLFMMASGVIAGASLWPLAVEVMSQEPLTRSAVLVIAALTVLSVLNIFLIQSIYVLRQLALIKAQADTAIGLHFFL